VRITADKQALKGNPVVDGSDVVNLFRPAVWAGLENRSSRWSGLQVQVFGVVWASLESRNRGGRARETNRPCVTPPNWNQGPSTLAVQSYAEMGVSRKGDRNQASRLSVV